MRVLICPHELSIGGSQINAIDLAAAVANEGHEVCIYGVPGPLVKYVEARGLRFLSARRFRYRPAPNRMLQILRIVKEESIDLVHAYEWPPCLDAYFGAGLLSNVPILCTVLSMSVMRIVPSSLPLIMGTEELGDQARKVHRGDVWVLEPPIDVVFDHPGIDGSEFRITNGVGKDELVVVSVSRLAIDLKLDALVRAIDAADILAAKIPLRLVLVGDGPARAALEERAGTVNRRWGREVVQFVGAMLDPRPAYAAADVVIGMGSSALRALSIGRPVVVQGESAFSEIFEPATLELFLRQGFYGLSDGVTGASRLADQINALLSDKARREGLARYGRKIVVERFSLARAAQLQMDVYKQVVSKPPPRSLGSAVRSAAMALALEMGNHDPRKKILRKTRERQLLSAASHGSWPPT